MERYVDKLPFLVRHGALLLFPTVGGLVVNQELGLNSNKITHFSDI